VGYGRTDAGTISMSFGPLNCEGGERRLNVLITRAKQRCVVFSNITADDIDLSRTNSEGVRHLKGYLQFAEKGFIDHQEPSDREPDSPFEIEVAAAIRSLGYEVHYQIGSAGYFVDLAIVDPASPGRYLLGIECDGATYHSSRWARDRDRLRQQVLEGLGWTIHRIWSKSWFEDSESELKKVKAAADRAQLEKPVRSGHATEFSVSAIERAESSAIRVSHMSVPYEVAVLKNMKRIFDFETVHDMTIQRMLLQVIDVESPIFVEEAIRRALSATSVARTCARIRGKFEAALEALHSTGKIRLEGHIAWSIDNNDVRVRDRSAADTSKKIEHVPLAELEKACVCVIRQACSIRLEDLHREILGILGLGALSKSRRGYLDRAVARFIRLGRIKNDNGRIVLCGNSS
jgi:very-short-patch-repair endonuclease